MSDHDGGPGSTSGMTTLLALVALGILLGGSSESLADAVVAEATGGVPFVDLPFKGVAWVLNALIPGT